MNLPPDKKKKNHSEGSLCLLVLMRQMRNVS